jgi:hypothetical protein
MVFRVRHIMVSIAALMGVLHTARAQLAADVRIEMDDDVPQAIAVQVRAKLSETSCPGVLRVRLASKPRPVLTIERVPVGATGAALAQLSRSVNLPDDPEEQARLAAHLAFNLCTNEADEFLKSLRKKPDSGAERDVDPSPDAQLDADADANADAEAATPISDAIAPKPQPERKPANITPQTPQRTKTCVRGEAAPFSPVAFSLFTPVGLPSSAPTTSLFVGTLYGRYVWTHGLALGTVLHAECETYGASFAGISITEGPVDGAAFSLLSIHRSPVRGVTAAPLVIAGDVQGVLAGLVNIRTGELRGIEVGNVNLDVGPSQGAVLGLVNIGTGSIHGMQAGLINVHTQTLHGMQVGLINVGYEVRGVQAGLINVARDSDASFGLQSISWAQKVRPYAWTSTITPLQAGLQWEGKTVFAGLGFGRLLQDLISRGRLALGFQLGIHILKPKTEGVLLDTLLAIDGSTEGDRGRVLDIARLGARIGYRFQPRFAPFLYGGAATETQYLPETPETATITIKPEFGAGVLF